MKKQEICTNIETSLFFEHEKVVLKRNTKPRRFFTVRNEYSMSSNLPEVNKSYLKLHPEASEIVLPLLLPYLSVKQRILSQLVCQLWKRIIQKWGVATSIDVANPSFSKINRCMLRGILRHSYCSLHTLVLNDYRDLEDNDLLPAMPYFRKLRYIDISRCILITDTTLMYISQYLGKTLKVLYMKGLVRVSDVGMKSICDNCVNIRVLELSEVPITDESGVCIGNKLTNLEALYMRDNFRLTNKSIDIITSQCSCLSQLTIWGCTRIQSISFGIDNLVLLNLWGCHGLTDNALGSMSSLSNLRSLILSECHRLTDKSIILLCKTIPQLHHLHLRYLKRITDASVHCIAQNIPSIYTLDLTFCTRITANAVVDLLLMRPNISEIRLCSCNQLSAEGIRQLVNELSKPNNTLSVLDVRFCLQNMDDSVMANLENTFFNAGFQNPTPGFFCRPARWTKNQKERIEDQILEDYDGKGKHMNNGINLAYAIDRNS